MSENINLNALLPLIIQCTNNDIQEPINVIYYDKHENQTSKNTMGHTIKSTLKCNRIISINNMFFWTGKNMKKYTPFKYFKECITLPRHIFMNIWDANSWNYIFMKSLSCSDYLFSVSLNRTELPNQSKQYVDKLILTPIKKYVKKCFILIIENKDIITYYVHVLSDVNVLGTVSQHMSSIIIADEEIIVKDIFHFFGMPDENFTLNFISGLIKKINNSCANKPEEVVKCEKKRGRCTFHEKEHITHTPSAAQILTSFTPNKKVRLPISFTNGLSPFMINNDDDTKLPEFNSNIF